MGDLPQPVAVHPCLHYILTIRLFFVGDVDRELARSTTPWAEEPMGSL
jgi:hypothetical protein